VVTGDLLDDVDLGLGVGAPRRDGDVVVVADRCAGEADRLEQVAHGDGDEVDADDRAGPLGADPHRTTDRQLAALVDDPGSERGGVAEQLGEAQRRQLEDLGVGALLEAGRRLGTQAEAARGPGDGERLEPGQLEQHIGGGGGDLGVGATHDPGDADRGVLASQINRSSAMKVRSTSSRVTRVSPSRARRTRSPPPPSRARS
jgi:hypothetical protein